MRSTMLKKMFFYIKNFFQNKKKLATTTFISYEEYLNYSNANKEAHYTKIEYEKSLYTSNKIFSTKGFCAVCNKEVEFLTTFDYAHRDESTNSLIPNYREHLRCPKCNLNNRMRASLHFFCTNLGAKKSSRIYITEQTTPTYKQLSNIFPHIVGSEYLGNNVNRNGANSTLRHEDLTNLTFSDNSFNYVISFDVLEHIPNYNKALTETYRVLDNEGIFLFTVPFATNSKEHITRATIDTTGNITHLLPPEYHVDLISNDGCLCFYHFGWKILNDLKSVGFKSAKIEEYWSKEFGYLGNGLFIVAKK